MNALLWLKNNNVYYNEIVIDHDRIDKISSQYYVENIKTMKEEEFKDLPIAEKNTNKKAPTIEKPTKKILEEKTKKSDSTDRKILEEKTLNSDNSPKKILEEKTKNSISSPKKILVENKNSNQIEIQTKTDKNVQIFNESGVFVKPLQDSEYLKITNFLNEAFEKKNLDKDNNNKNLNKIVVEYPVLKEPLNEFDTEGI